MKRLAAILALMCAGVMYAQNIDTSGVRYAENYGQWTIPQGTSPTSGTILWDTAALCAPTSVGNVIHPIRVGKSVRIVDADPTQSETVRITTARDTGSNCFMTASMAHVHTSYTVQSAMAGLQEAIDAGLTAGGAVVVVTPKWRAMGGTTSMLTAATGGSNISILDSRSSFYQSYLWNGANYTLVSNYLSGQPPGNQVIQQPAGTYTTVNGLKTLGFVPSINVDQANPLLPSWLQTGYTLSLSTQATSAIGNMFGAISAVRIGHGWRNLPDMGMNVSAYYARADLNSPAQIGGLIAAEGNHYGAGDGVAFESAVFCTGVSRGTDEGCKPLRLSASTHSQHWGITISTLTNDALGETIVAPANDGSGNPVALDGHFLSTQPEDTLIINLNPAKLWNAGNVNYITNCPAGPFQAYNYVCVTGDSTSNISSHFGTSTATTLLQAVPISANGLRDQFAAGPIAFDLPLASVSGFTVNSLITISDDQPTFETTEVLGVNTANNTIHVYLSKEHSQGSVVTVGGGVGNEINFPADTILQNQWPRPVDQGPNYSDYRLGFPVIATLPGNMLVTTQFPFGQNPALGTQAYASRFITSAPTATTTVSGGQLTAITMTNMGNLGYTFLPGYSNRGSAIGGYAPIPALTFTGGNCTTQPTAYYKLNVVNSNQGVSPVITSPGAGCDNTLAIVTPSTSYYANAYEIRPALWARSNYNPNWLSLQDDPQSPLNQGDFNRQRTASTTGYMVLSGVNPCTTTSGFCQGDAIEDVMAMHQVQAAQVVFEKPQMDVGAQGDAMRFVFGGRGFADYLMNVTNDTVVSKYLGFASAHYTSDAVGHGFTDPPYAFSFRGIFNGLLNLDQPLANHSGADLGLFNIGCYTTDPDAPCHNGIFYNQHLYREEVGNGFQDLYNDATTGRFVAYSTKEGNGGWQGNHIALDGTPGMNGICNSNFVIKNGIVVSCTQ